MNEASDSVVKAWRNLEWYRKTMPWALSIAASSLAILCVSLLLNVYFILSNPEPKYFAVTSDLRVKQMTPLSQPVMSRTGLMNWVTQAVTETLSLNFVHWRQQLTKARSAYTNKAFNSLVNSLLESGNMDYIRENRLTVSVSAPKAPVMLATGYIGDSKAWKIQVPLVLTYESSKGTASTQKLVATIVVKRVSTLTNKRGVAIDQVVLKKTG